MQRRRAPTDRFDGRALHDALVPFARVKTPGFDWEVNSYLKTKRSQAPDREGLQRSAPLLEVTLAFCPHGYPKHGLLRDVLAGLDVSYNIRSPQVPTFKSRSDWANDAADAIRLATKHVVDLKKSGTTYLPPTLQSLVSKITVDETATFAPRIPFSWAELPVAPATSDPLPLPMPQASRARQLRAQDSCASSAAPVVFCSAACKCPECRVSQPMPADSPRSATSMLAQASNPVSAARGGQKKRALGQPRAAKKPAADIPDAIVTASISKKPSVVVSKKPAAAAPADPTCCHLVHRQHPPTRVEAYVMYAGKFLCGITRRASPKYYEATAKVVQELSDGVLRPESARERLRELADSP